MTTTQTTNAPIFPVTMKTAGGTYAVAWDQRDYDVKAGNLTETGIAFAVEPFLTH